jgi:cell pole-organizing protein PopZ
VLMLDASMMVQQERAVTEEPPEPMPEPVVLPVATLVAPEAAAAAASSVDALMRTLHTEQSMRVTSLGPTIEDIVRQEIRPLLKGWLDANLPPLVERLVRIEIERVVGRVRT